MLPGAPSKPVVNTTTSPFGSTLFYGHNDLIFEVPPSLHFFCCSCSSFSYAAPLTELWCACRQVMRNGHVASICIFSTPA